MEEEGRSSIPRRSCAPCPCTPKSTPSREKEEAAKTTSTAAAALITMEENELIFWNRPSSSSNRPSSTSTFFYLESTFAGDLLLRHHLLCVLTRAAPAGLAAVETRQLSLAQALLRCSRRALLQQQLAGGSRAARGGPACAWMRPAGGKS
nr:unnamed protein product [Digitaria exilis]